MKADTCRKEPPALRALKCRLSVPGRGGEAIVGEGGMGVWSQIRETLTPGLGRLHLML